MKGSNIKEEISNAEKALEVLGGRIEKIDQFCIGDEKMERTIIIIEKIKQTPRNFPRKAGIPGKEPIC